MPLAEHMLGGKMPLMSDLGLQLPSGCQSMSTEAKKINK